MVLGILVGLLSVLAAGIGPTVGKPVASVGSTLMGIAFLAASFAAVRIRRRAGLVLLASEPLAVFLISSPFLWRTDLGPDDTVHGSVLKLLTVVGLTCVTPFLVFGGFWLHTARKEWPALCSSEPRSARKRVVIALTQCMALTVVVLAGSLVTAVLRSSLAGPGYDKDPGLYVRSLEPSHAVFTARVVWAGYGGKVQGKGAGDWAIGVVRERFWGLPQWTHVVILMDGLFWEGQTIFVKGGPDYGIFTRFLPIIRVAWAEQATLAKAQMQLLRKPLRPSEFRLMGFVFSPLSPRDVSKPRDAAHSGNQVIGMCEWFLFLSQRDRRLTGARILVTNSSGTKVISTDSDGMYELAGLQPDNYTFQLLDVPAYQVAEKWGLAKEDMVGIDAKQRDVYADWIGGIEGWVEDPEGGRAERGGASVAWCFGIQVRAEGQIRRLKWPEWFRCNQAVELETSALAGGLDRGIG